MKAAPENVAVLSGHLRRRLIWSLILLTMLAATVQGIAFWATEHWIERGSVQTLLERELDYRISADLRPSTREPRDIDNGIVSGLLYYRPSRGGPLPEEVLGLSPGWHGEVVIDGQLFQVLIRDAAPGDRVYLMHNLSPLRERDGRLIGSFVFGLSILGLLAMWVARRVADEALTPLARLVAQIRSLDPENRGVRLRPEGDLELDVIADALNGYMAELDEVIERERAFAAAASHELRTPLAVIRGAAELLESRPPDPTRPLARIQRAVAQAQEDLDALLALSRLRESQRTWILDLELLLPDWAEMDAGTTRLVWRLQPMLLTAAPGSIHVIFSNLLRNAVRAAGPQGTVTIELDENALRVLDDGPGVPVNELSMVFEPHFRGRDGGTGIGLYVARAMARRHGWQLTLANRDEGGAIAVLLFRPHADPRPAGAVSAAAT